MSNDLLAQQEYAKQLAASSMLPAHMKNNVANVLWAVGFAREVGLQPIQAITAVHVIDGKPTASAALISALVRKAGHRLRVSGDDKKAVASIWRRDDPEFEFRVEWDMERAKAAGLTGKGPWKAYPAAMLKARAITEVAREACQDAILGLQYTPEELGAEVDADGVVVTVPPPAKAAALPPPAAAPAADPVGWRDDKDRAWFMAEIGALGLDYDALAEWCQSLGKPRPSGMTFAARKQLLAAVADPGSKWGQHLARWLAARTPPPPPAVTTTSPSHDDDQPFFDEEA
jgi:hypothetical protein